MCVCVLGVRSAREATFNSTSPDMATQPVTSALTDDQREQFARDGFLTFDPAISDETLEGVLRDVGEKYSFEGAEEIDEFGVKYTPGSNPRITYAWKISEAVKQVARAPKVLDVLEELYDHKPLPFQTLNFMNGTEQHAHVDGMYFNSDPPGWMCGVWVALEDIDMENGPLLYYPGSHKLPLPTWDEMGDPNQSDFEHYDAFVAERARRYERHIEEQIERFGKEPQYGTIRKGEALIWAAHLIHGGSPQRDRSRTRHSQVTHYYFEGDFRHHCPLRREHDHTYYDYPGWIKSDTPPKVTPTVVGKTVAANVPVGAKVLVASGGNDELLDLGERQGLPFPQLDGEYRSFQQSTGPELVEMLERLRDQGARYLVFPGSEVLWISFYREFQGHLEERYETLVRDGATCVIFALD